MALFPLAHWHRRLTTPPNHNKKNVASVLNTRGQKSVKIAAASPVVWPPVSFTCVPYIRATKRTKTVRQRVNEIIFSKHVLYLTVIRFKYLIFYVINEGKIVNFASLTGTSPAEGP